MITASHSRWFQFIFDIYLSRAFKKHFKSLETIGEVEDKGMPVLVIANHISWWDGFWMLSLNKKHFHRNFHVMMLEDQLRKNMFLRQLGAFSLRKRSRDMLESFAYAARLLKQPRNMLLLFPQGEITSQYDYPLDFQKGWGRILSMTHNPLQLLMVVHLLDYFSDPKPTLRQYVFSPEQTTGFNGDELEEQYNDFLQQCLEQQKALR